MLLFSRLRSSPPSDAKVTPPHARLMHVSCRLMHVMRSLQVLCWPNAKVTTFNVARYGAIKSARYGAILPLQADPASTAGAAYDRAHATRSHRCPIPAIVKLSAVSQRNMRLLTPPRRRRLLRVLNSRSELRLPGTSS
jgi:hypothetical protein